MAHNTSASSNDDTVMDVTEERIARVYAQAFIEAAAKSNDTTPLVGEVSSIVSDLLPRFPKLEEVFRSALVSAEDKEQMLDRVFGGRASAVVLNFLKVLARHGRLSILRSIAQILRKLDAKRRGMTEVLVRVAAPINDSVQTDLLNRLRATLGGEPQLNVEIDPSLLAGMVVRVGDRVYDGSVATQLEQTRRGMIERITESIETSPGRFLSTAK